MMRRVVYLPISPSLSNPRMADALATAVLEARRLRQLTVEQLRSKLRSEARSVTSVFILALLLLFRPAWVCAWLPSRRLIIWVVIGALCSIVGSLWLARRLASTDALRMSKDALQALATKPRVHGVAACRGKAEERIGGAVLLTGATGFVGGSVLFQLLARAEALAISRIVVVVRRKSGRSPEVRLATLKANPAFAEVREAFGRLVSVMEGDVTQRDFGLDGVPRAWPFSEPLKAVLHCAADVRFDLPLRAAAISSITATLQTAQLAVQWKASRFVFVSTAFVHAVPSKSRLEEKLVELRDFDPLELYRDALADGRWAEKAMHALNFPNTYTFTKAIAEHLVLRFARSESLDARIVRPSIVGPAWAAPYPAWCGDKPSTAISAILLTRLRVVRVWKVSRHVFPIVPVDIVASVAIDAMASSPDRSLNPITHAAVDASEGERLFSSYQCISRPCRWHALKGEVSLAEAGLYLRLHRWVQTTGLPFWLVHSVLNVGPWALAVWCCSATSFVTRVVPFGANSPSRYSDYARTMKGLASLPMQYEAFTGPAIAWSFRSEVRLPSDWDPMEYCALIFRGVEAFALHGTKTPPTQAALTAVQEMRIPPSTSCFNDALFTFGTPSPSLFLSFAAFLIRRCLASMKLTVSVDATTLDSVAELALPLVICPNHRSLLDFLIVGAVSFQLRPLLPALQVPSVAADVEFESLPGLGRILAALGVFFVRRGGRRVQPDPALRAEVGRVFRKGGPLAIFLEGTRSRGRRQLRLRSGLLRALRDVAQGPVALVPLTLSYELLPEDSTFFDELRGEPRRPLRTMALVRWVNRRCFLGEGPSLGEAHVRLGEARVLDASTDLPAMLSDVQEQLAALTAVSTLHTRALAEMLNLPVAAVVSAFAAAHLPVRRGSSCLDLEMPLTDAERWPLVLQAAIILRSRLPTAWSRWLVEPGVEEGFGLSASKAPVPLGARVGSEASAVRCGSSGADAEEALEPLTIEDVACALTAKLAAAQCFAEDVAERLREDSSLDPNEDHLLQQLLKPYRAGAEMLPAPLAWGAARVVAERLGRPAEAKADIGSAKAESPVAPEWPVSIEAASVSTNMEALDRWGFQDTRFQAHWVDGRPAVRMTSSRYGAIGRQPLFQLWSFFEQELKTCLDPRNTLPSRPLPAVPPPAEGLAEKLRSLAPAECVIVDNEARVRAATGHSLADIWSLRAGELGRVFDAVFRPRTEDDVVSVLQLAARDEGFAVIPIGGRTNVTSATACPPKSVDPRPFVALDMRSLSAVRWVNKEDCLACVEAGITGVALQAALKEQGVDMGTRGSEDLERAGGFLILIIINCEEFSGLLAQTLPATSHCDERAREGKRRAEAAMKSQKKVGAKQLASPPHVSLPSFASHSCQLRKNEGVPRVAI